ncbi:unnamed protein product [Adineta steineri]|uniref:CHHC U11-48K-type domain-containing protein n=1 Tax=Adineta steineri TaxID=433720 RepID=A0A814LGW7_9BILA|nr:unnamed protein product [Adineta steineri]CAF0955639.1 unnamed protein product [Adineta steineri]CAF0971409.1 unnamed protein product [Adineta steineri]CAF1027653.1 unnamed protein product [Adineta steineri]CAF1063378.1 unnamed protein product [Adineta steineri]
MSSSAFEDGEYLTCPFNPAHQVISNNFKHHILRCSQHHPDVKTIKCLFNGAHKIKPPNYYDHLCECPDNPAS